MSAVDYHAKQFFLTYPRCEADKEALRDFLVLECGGEDYIIARETHEDGAYHLHAYIRFGRPKRVRDANYFDLRSGEHTYHPNIQTVRSPAACQKYVAKDGDYISNIPVGQVKLSYGEIIKNSSSASEFLATLEEQYPRDVVLNLARAEAYARYKWPVVPEQEPIEFTRFVIPDELQAWYEDNVVNKENGTQISPHAYIGCFYSVLPAGGPQSPPLAPLTH